MFGISLPVVQVTLTPRNLIQTNILLRYGWTDGVTTETGVPSYGLRRLWMAA
jgi:hypothetical protein